MGMSPSGKKNEEGNRLARSPFGTRHFPLNREDMTADRTREHQNPRLQAGGMVGRGEAAEKESMFHAGTRRADGYAAGYSLRESKG